MLSSVSFEFCRDLAMLFEFSDCKLSDGLTTLGTFEGPLTFTSSLIGALLAGGTVVDYF